MDAERWQEVGRVYQAALEQPPDARGDFLIEACGGDEALRREVESLLAQEHVDTFVDRDVDAIALDLFDRPRALSPGTMVGSYRVVDLIGTGGMGRSIAPSMSGCSGTWQSKSCRTYSWTTPIA